jgi:hypothetical protein
VPMTGQELEQKIYELTPEYFENQDSEIPDQILELAEQLRELDH